MSSVNPETGLFPCHKWESVKESLGIIFCKVTKSLNTFVFSFRVNRKMSSTSLRVILRMQVPMGISQRSLVSVKPFVCITSSCLLDKVVERIFERHCLHTKFLVVLGSQPIVFLWGKNKLKHQNTVFSSHGRNGHVGLGSKLQLLLANCQSENWYLFWRGGGHGSVGQLPVGFHS